MALKKGVKKKEHEKLDEATIERVIVLLAETPPISKKQACEILNISYNTTRLNNIIEEHLDKQDRRKKNFERVKGTPLTEHDTSMIVTSFLQGHPIADISEYVFRGPSIVNRVLETIGVPTRVKGDEANKNAFLPDECVLTEPPKPGTILWSAKYHSACELIKEDLAPNRDGSRSYRIFVFQASDSGRKAGFYASQKLEELGSLAHLEKYVKLTQLIPEK